MKKLKEKMFKRPIKKIYKKKDVNLFPLNYDDNRIMTRYKKF